MEGSWEGLCIPITIRIFFLPVHRTFENFHVKIPLAMETWVLFSTATKTGLGFFRNAKGPWGDLGQLSPTSLLSLRLCSFLLLERFRRELIMEFRGYGRSSTTGLQCRLVGSPCSPRNSQESLPTPQFKSINSSVLSFLDSPTLTSIGDHRKNHSLD